MRSPFFTRSIRLIISVAVLAFCAGGAIAVTPAEGAKSGPIFRYVFKKTGGEVYAATSADRKKFDSSKNIELIQMLGYVFTEPAQGTVPLIQMARVKLNGPTEYRLITNAAMVEYLQTINQPGFSKWKPYPSTDGIVGYVSKTGGKSMLGAYAFTQSNVNGDGPRYRVEGKEYDQWKKLPGVVFESVPSFYIWNTKPAELLLAGVILTPGVNIIQGVAFTDQSLRFALYENGKNGMVVDTTRHYATPTKPLVLYRKDALNCKPDGCEFNFGFFVMRNKSGSTLDTYVITYQPNYQAGNSTQFGANDKSKGMVLPIPIKNGDNFIEVKIKPYHANEDTNAANSSFKVKVVLMP